METKDLERRDLNGKLWLTTARRVADGRLLIESAIRAPRKQYAWVAEEKLEIKEGLKSLLPFLRYTIEIGGVTFTVRGTSQGSRPAAVRVKEGPKQVGMVSERATHGIVQAFQVAVNIMTALKREGRFTKEAFNTRKVFELGSLSVLG